MQTGRVARFDGSVGVGELVVDTAPPLAIFFQVVSVADGSRSIEVGARVAFRLGLAPTGVFEAIDIVKI